MTTLVPGAAAPSFSLVAIDGRTVHLSDYAGRRVLLAFLRNARCAVCNLWVHETMKRAPAWRDAGLEVIAIFESSADRLVEQFSGRVPPFVVAADPEGVLHDTFGSRVDAARVQSIVQSGAGEAALAAARAAGFEPRMEEGANFFRLPAEILVERDGTIAFVHVAEEVTNHLDPELIERFGTDGLAAFQPAT